MSKIAEKRTDEIVGEFHEGDYTDHSRHNTEWVAFKKGYDQAIEDSMEKALAYLNSKFYFNNVFYGVVSTDFYSIEEMFEDFKNYMKDENEN